MDNRISKKYIVVYLLDTTLSFDKAYTYLPLDESMLIGQLVEVPFGAGNSLRRAVIVGQTNYCQYKSIKKVESILLKEAIFLPDQIDLAKEMKRRYFCTYGQALKTISPPTVFTVGKKKMKACSLVDAAEARDMLADDALTSIQQQRVVEMLLQIDNALAQEILQACQVSNSVLKTLEKKNIIRFFDKKIDREEKKAEIWQEDDVEYLNPDQEKAFDQILAIKSSPQKLKEGLLFGVTGSGKTEIYLRLAKKMLQEKKTVIILVPEISLTPLMISRFTKKFGDKIAVWHSHLTSTQRFEQWQKILREDKKIVVGARSAIFAPMKNLGLIIIDEEQENSYSSESVPRYSAHDIARIRAIQHDSILLLGSATPSIETYYRTQNNNTDLFVLPKRAKQAPLPKIHLTQMKDEFLREDFDYIFSQSLLNNMRKTFESGGQVMLFLNRRGLTSALQCQDCGKVIQCPDCEVSMTIHRNQHNNKHNRLICHYCGRIEEVITTCPVCNSEQMKSFGLGTQKIEEAFYQQFPEYKALRMDFDTMIGVNPHQNILTAFGQGKADCLIGTQMIAKGHDFPNVRTVGILAVDSMLKTGSYKSEERAFQLITQAAGRSGRSDIQGDVFIQGYDLSNYVITCAAAQDYRKFYNEEIEYRQRACFPPFGQIGFAVFQSLSEMAARHEANLMFELLKKAMQDNAEYFSNTSLYPPSLAPIPRLRKRFRYRLIIKSDAKIKIAQLFHLEAARKKQRGVGLNMDINPEHML